MPLSEEELRLLEQMERALVEEDPKLASTLRGTSLRRTARRRAVLAGACFLVGIAVMMSGAITETWPLGIAGFVIMLGSATIAVTAIRGQQAAGSESRSSGHPAHGFTVIDGGRKIVLDGGGTTQILRFNSPNFRALDITVTLQDLALVNGKAINNTIAAPSEKASEASASPGSIVWSPSMTPSSAAAMPPTTEPLTPSRIVCQSFSGSLPGTAKRASSPMIRPETARESSAPSTARA